MKKIGIIIGRKQLILSVLTLILGTAVYLNYVLGGGNGLTSVNKDLTTEITQAQNTHASNDPDQYGKAELVNAALDKADYFAQARLDKQTSRDHAVQTLQSIIGGGDISHDEMVTNAIDAVSISQSIKSENIIENLILSQGFSDCVAYLDGQSAKIVVESEGLTPSQAAAIKEIVLSESDIPAEGIRIFEVKS